MESLSKLLYLLEPAPVTLITTAVAVTFGSAFRALNYGKEMERNRDLSEASITLDRSQALMIPVMSSFSLLLMFYLFSSVSQLLTAFTAIASASSLFFCLSPYVAYLKTQFGLADPFVSRCCSKSFTRLQAILLVVCSFIVASWLVSGHWILNNLLGISICIAFVSHVRLPNIKICAMLLLCLFVYDIFWVFFSERFFGANVMVSVATQQASNPVHTVANSLSLPGLQLITKKLELPVKIVFPRNLLGGVVPGENATDFMMLGLGDMAIPGMLLALVLCFDYRKSRDIVNLFELHSSKGHKYIWYALPGYAIGLVTALAAGVLTHSPQPALLYLVPSTLGPVIVISWMKRELLELWEGNIPNLNDKDRETVEDPVTDPISGEKTEKNVFVIFYAGERAKAKILKICEAFGANRYPFAEELGKQAQMITEVSGRLVELKTTIDAGLHHRDNLLNAIGAQFEQWDVLVRKEKSIHHTLNMLSLDVTKKCLVAEGWSPVFANKQIQDALQRAALDSNSQVNAIFQVLHTRELPPTYFRTNKFTSSYQGIIDSYGVAKYQEANPTVYTVVTFPFLFAVMFGDWGHGICLLLAALYFIIREKKLSSQKLDDITEMTFGGRYVILLMALFSIYTGFIYNEFFSVPFALFAPSAYDCRDLSCRDATTVGLIKVRDTYPFGVDPVWHGTRSELPFLNSLKMKMSILLGVAQMNLGIVMSYCNALFFRNKVNVWFQFIPQMIFLNSLFGYLALLIIVKWCTGSQADLYHILIYMFLSPTDDLGENQLFVGQKNLQLVLLLLAFVSVPWMLLPKPFILKKQHDARHGAESYTPLESTDESLQVESNHDSHGHEEFEFSEVFVHQLIHTIEFVLGAVSNTASYLRLWALSLAHSELSSVFYEKVLLMAWGYNNVIILIVGLIVFIFATVGVLLVMETLSAFLHALRLHWVEFQNKFYEGDGYKFHPFSFSLLDDEE